MLNKLNYFWSYCPFLWYITKNFWFNHIFHDINSTTEKQEKDLVRYFQSREWIKQTSCRKIPKNNFDPIVQWNGKQFLYLSPCRLSERRHLTQMGDLRKKAGIMRWSTYFHRWIPCTLVVPARLEELRWEKWACLSIEGQIFCLGSFNQPVCANQS